MSIKYIWNVRGWTRSLMCSWKIYAFPYVHLWSFHLSLSSTSPLAVWRPAGNSNSTFPKPSSSSLLNLFHHLYSFSPCVHPISTPCCDFSTPPLTAHTLSVAGLSFSILSTSCSFKNATSSVKFSSSSVSPSVFLLPLVSIACIHPQHCHKQSSSQRHSYILCTSPSDCRLQLFSLVLQRVVIHSSSRPHPVPWSPLQFVLNPIRQIPLLLLWFS